VPGVADMAASGQVVRRPDAGPYGCRPDRPAVFAKQGRPDAIEREARVLAHLHRRGARGAPLAPAPLAWHRAEGVLLVEELAGSSLHDLLGSSEPRDAVLARRLGACLARLHAVAPGRLPQAVDHVPNLELDARQAAELPGALLDLIGMLQRARGLGRAFAELREESPRDVLVHGDAKLDNVVAGPDDRVRLVDFEHAGAGDPAWDLGASTGDYLSRWLLSVRASAAAGLAAWLERATVPRARCTASARAVLAGYEQERPLPDRDRVAACAGIFLMHRAQAWVERYGTLTAKPMLLARCGAHLAVARWAALGPLLEDRP
jgi:aminoglycoside phosphotransferase (APT) family kinase protein